MAKLDFKQKGLLSLLLAEDPSAQQYLYNWNKLKTYDDEIKRYEDIISKAEAFSKSFSVSGRCVRPTKTKTLFRNIL